MTIRGIELLSDAKKLPFLGEGIQQIRLGGEEWFAKNGLPSRLHEDWKYLGLKPLMDQKFETSFQERFLSSTEMHQLSQTLLAGAIPIVMINGKIDRTLSDLNALPEGLTIQEVQGAVSEIKNAFDALSDAYFGQGIQIQVRDGAKIEKPLYLRFHSFCGDGSPLMIHPRVRISVGSRSSIQVVEHSTGQTNARYFVNQKMDVDVANDAQIEMIRLQDQGTRALHFSNLKWISQKGSHSKILTVHLGGEISRDSLFCSLSDVHADLKLMSVSNLSGTQQLDQFTHLRHEVEEGTSDQVVKSLVRDQAKVSFTGRIHILPGAQKTQSSQLSQSLLLSDRAESNNRPQLMIEADDVKASHGATVGQLQEDEMFYLQSRGIDISQARVLLCQAFVMDLFDQVGDKETQKWLSTAVAEKLQKLELQP